MQNHLASTSVQAWAGNFMKTLQQPRPGTRYLTRTLRTSVKRNLLDEYRAASNRLILLDYDGVLSPFFTDPKKAAPEHSVTDIVTKLAEDPRNEVVLVSGRTKADLDNWFGGVPISLAAEHGAFVKKLGDRKWRSTIGNQADWQAHVLPVLEKYAAKTPKSFVEIKESTLVWHYRQASSYTSQKNLVILKRLLKPLARMHSLIVSSGNKILEVKSREANKGIAIQHWLNDNQDFVLALGDDDTDEDTFTSLPPGANTIKVGRGRTAARYRLSNVEQVLTLLKQLTK